MAAGQHVPFIASCFYAAIRSIVASSSIKQSVKGILTAGEQHLSVISEKLNYNVTSFLLGFQKTVMYSFEKLQKMARSIT